MGFIYPLIALGGCMILLIIRIYQVIPSSPPTKSSKRNPSSKCSIAIFLGSGGHTSEMRSLLSTLPFDRYSPRKYIYCHNDEISLRAISELESKKGDVRTQNSYTLLPLPRARKVSEPLLSTLISASKTLIVSLWHVSLLPMLKDPREPYAEVLLINGPGTCVVLVLVSYIRRIVGLKYTKIIYIESFARVRSLSLSGKLVRPFVDKFLVQWPEAGGRGGRVECKGWLV
ncbi:hypothetical protein L486_00735 [Kwoniella mangroviensis CBS 10435]|uniref:UDP-N-acetylglucosamine transferase subunit ALG14 n=1 Tax=Kwoniella mangroviensis CBS 10435 TaxID=1331196 RepID=A0A1B9IZX8_9TREE|nr:hypothetical protein L486_00735 [Kwoniella mangroviensis CBS 10435]